MHSKLSEIFGNKKILILGFGKEGQSTYHLLRKWFPDMPIGIADANSMSYDGMLDDNVKFFGGPGYLDACRDFDLVIKSPGIPYDLVKKYSRKEAITSQTDLFLKAFSSQVIGVTGTKGKSTVTSLIHHILYAAGYKAVLAGNIGIPPLGLIDTIMEDSVIVFEMSSHQLEHISIAPHISVILNLFPEHLDHYRDFTAYKMAKFNIGKLQPDQGTLVYNLDDEIIRELIEEQPELKKLLSFSYSDASANAYLTGHTIHLKNTGSDFLIHTDALQDLPGKHNLLNMMAASLACMEKGITEEELVLGISTYHRLEHRLEYAGAFRGIHFYNDSIATIPEACIGALDTLGHVDLLILGGYDRGLDYSKLYMALARHKVPELVFMGKAGTRMAKELSQFEEMQYMPGVTIASSLEEAFQKIWHKLGAGDVCLLSPAAASYGMFSNFEERGRIFKKLAASA